MIGEATRLRWVDIDFEKRSRPGPSGERGNPRMLAISNKLKAMLIELRERRHPIGYSLMM
jgi:integrase